MPTQKEIAEFVVMTNRIQPATKPTTGRLIQTVGTQETVLADNLSFALLQIKKKAALDAGVPRKQLRITY